MDKKQIIVLYHANCPDGFGGAYSAWKKFGDTALYLPVKHGEQPPENLSGADLYFVDFVYKKEQMDYIVANAAKVVVLDHHLGVKDIVESMQSYVFDEKRSGSTIAWSYFHPNTPVPMLLRYIENGDLYNFVLPHAREILSYIYTEPFEFSKFDKLITLFEDKDERQKMIVRGTFYRSYHTYIVEKIAKNAEMVRFEGYNCYAVSTLGFFTSDVGHILAEKHPPLSLLLSAHVDGIRVSIRGNGTVDVSKIAQKYGGNGHPNAAAFSISYNEPIPWKSIKEDI